MLKTVTMDFEYMNIIPGPPHSPTEMFQQACSNDKVTLDSWRDIWLKNAKENHEKFGPFAEKSIGATHNKHKLKPVICVGSGPSIKENIKDLADSKEIPILSCLHNYHMLIDHGVKHIEGFVSLDAGDVVIEEIAEGGKHDLEYYLETTRDHTLYASIVSPPKLLELWRGKIVFFTTPFPDKFLIDGMQEIESFHNYITTGGNVLGACVYIAKAIHGANPIVFVGADFSFSYDRKFHGWDSKYDKDLGKVLRATDVWGNKVLTWQSYFNFSQYFCWLACVVPGLYINCTEGGILGAYPDGIVSQIMQMDLKKLIRMYSMSEDTLEQCLNPTVSSNKILY